MTTITETRYSLRYTSNDAPSDNASANCASAWDTLGEARTHMVELRALGFADDARIYRVVTVIQSDPSFGIWADELGTILSETLTDLTEA